jgi:hypothetical protein
MKKDIKECKHRHQAYDKEAVKAKYGEDAPAHWQGCCSAECHATAMRAIWG